MDTSLETEQQRPVSVVESLLHRFTILQVFILVSLGIAAGDSSRPTQTFGPIDRRSSISEVVQLEIEHIGPDRGCAFSRRLTPTFWLCGCYTRITKAALLGIDHTSLSRKISRLESRLLSVWLSLHSISQPFQAHSTAQEQDLRYVS
jgi:hypothetical protein